MHTLLTETSEDLCHNTYTGYELFKMIFFYHHDDTYRPLNMKDNTIIMDFNSHKSKLPMFCPPKYTALRIYYKASIYRLIMRKM